MAMIEPREFTAEDILALRTIIENFARCIVGRDREAQVLLGAAAVGALCERLGPMDDMDQMAVSTRLQAAFTRGESIAAATRQGHVKPVAGP